ncbi:oxidoreductase [Actinophytocola oryzae]|uniref:Aryl-alcohol dehydrogenase-like predicted oxidoreductase n=1 Tax=Actinophytocola oryzae TaxID=502181 RepID=A0A4R7UVJ4_9PSEU|nr:oxidoreductase [Actinophytocola oryzae]TDV40739.1 aryl-alcohol dehydrogenase-like predicted oxidoreductase [Actinophytocola oryzae]
MDIKRMGYGAMQLAGPGVFGPPRDRGEAIAVLRTAVELGVDHIDTADFYGPTVVNELLREALHPYDGLTVVTKVGARRGPNGEWVHQREPEDLRRQVHENLEHLGVDVLDVVNMRVGAVDGPDETPITPQFETLAELQQQGLIRHLGISTASDKQLTEAQGIAPVVTVQNEYNVVNRRDDALIERCAAEGITYVPYFPLGGFTPLQSETLSKVAAGLDATPHQVALAWLLQHSPAIALIPGTSSVAHLRENMAAEDLVLPADAVAELDSIGA